MRAERTAIQQALDRFRWNRRKAADYLGVSYKTLLNKMKECGIRPAHTVITNAGTAPRSPARRVPRDDETVVTVSSRDRIQRVVAQQPTVDQPDAATIPNAAAEPVGDVDISLPVKNGNGEGTIDLSIKDDRISLIVRDAPINAVLGVIAQQHGLNVVTAEDVNGQISVTLTDVSLVSALNAILRTNGYTWTRQDDIILVTALSATSAAPAAAQGRELRVITLNYLSAADADLVVQGLLSPAGKSFSIKSDPLDSRRTKEQLVVEDLPEYLSRIEEYLAQSDHAPRQVLIEAHILQVLLKDDTKHGVNIQQALARIDNTDITFRSNGLASPTASPAYFFGIDGTDLDVLVELIKQTTDSKTLAAPKVLVINGQEARIQIGAQLGFNVTTTTQTSTLQQVQFLDVGVLLRVTPQITDDGQILMKVKPEVSTGEINPTTGLPQEQTTEVETTVMLQDGCGMVVGGLIKEEDVENQAKLPIMGDLWLVGRLFQRRTFVHSRNEIIIVLVPRLLPYGETAQSQADTEMLRATSPLLGPQLERIDRRPVEPELPDAVRNPRKLDPSRIRRYR